MLKTKNYPKKTSNDLEELHPDFSERKEERPAWHVGVFCEKLGITAYALENYSNFKTHSICFRKLLILKIIFYLTMEIFLKQDIF